MLYKPYHTGIAPLAIAVLLPAFTFSTDFLHHSPIALPSIPIYTKNERNLVEYLSIVTGLFIANKKS
jgi:hypothetical protein